MINDGLIGFPQKDGTILYTSSAGLYWELEKGYDKKIRFDGLITGLRSWVYNKKRYNSIKNNQGVQGWNVAENRDAFVEICRPNETNGMTWAKCAYLLCGTKLYNVNFRYKTEKERLIGDCLITFSGLRAIAKKRNDIRLIQERARNKKLKAEIATRRKNKLALDKATEKFMAATAKGAVRKTIVLPVSTTIETWNEVVLQSKKPVVALFSYCPYRDQYLMESYAKEQPKTKFVICEIIARREGHWSQKYLKDTYPGRDALFLLNGVCIETFQAPSHEKIKETAKLRPRILVIENNGLFPDMHGNKLPGFTHVKSSKAALAALRSSRFDEVWCDYRLSENDTIRPVVRWLDEKHLKSIKNIRILTHIEILHNYFDISLGNYYKMHALRKHNSPTWRAFFPLPLPKRP